MSDLAGKFHGLILDMDGVIYRGERALPGALEIFPALREAGISFILLTNNATLTPSDFAAKLARMGINVAPERILTSAGATALYLQKNYPEGGGVYVLGEAGLVSSVLDVPGFRADGWQPDFVVAGLFFGFNYDALQRACSAIRRGATFIATNRDATLPVDGGELWPGAGSIVAAIETGSDVSPITIGKPNTYMAQLALDLLGLPKEEVLCVGDRLDTDIEMGKRSGIPTGLVLTGVSSRVEAGMYDEPPDYIFEDLPELMSILALKGAN